MRIEVSNGEIIDKYTILEIKLEKIMNPDKLDNIRKEYNEVKKVVNFIYHEEKDQKTLADLHTDLLNINKTLWNIEDQIREHERMELFNSDFIELARSVYYNNDERAEVKNKINSLTGSSLVEEKSYEAY